MPQQPRVMAMTDCRVCDLDTGTNFIKFPRGSFSTRMGEVGAGAWRRWWGVRCFAKDIS
jgi:hypothetical protein